MELGKDGFVVAGSKDGVLVALRVGGGKEASEGDSLGSRFGTVLDGMDVDGSRVSDCVGTKVMPSVGSLLGSDDGVSVAGRTDSDEGVPVGLMDEEVDDGFEVGASVGTRYGADEGDPVGSKDGELTGRVVGLGEGSKVGSRDGVDMGMGDEFEDGVEEGSRVGDSVGDNDENDGVSDGDSVGINDGRSVVGIEVGLTDGIVGT